MTVEREGDVFSFERVGRNITVEEVTVRVQFLLIIPAEEDFRVVPVGEVPYHVAIELLFGGGACALVEHEVLRPHHAWRHPPPFAITRLEDSGDAEGASTRLRLGDDSSGG